MNSQKAEKPRFSSFRRKPESSQIKWFWTPEFAGVTAWGTFYEAVIIDGLVKSLKMLFSVIPAEAGIQSSQIVINSLDSGFHRSDDFLRSRHNCLAANSLSPQNCGRGLG